MKKTIPWIGIMNVVDNIRVIPISPYLLCQEIYLNNPWRILVCCILLNKTNGRNVHKIRAELFERWPDPESMMKADFDELSEFLRPLGFYRRRAMILRKFSLQWLYRKYTDVRELMGIGQYARDSYSIFVEDNIDVDPSDKVLRKYLKWRKEQNPL